MDGADLDVDDLFGDPGSLGDTSLQVTLPVPDLNGVQHLSMPVKGLAQRLNVLQSHGSCQRIAWSRQGGIAFITTDGLRVQHQCLKLHQSTGTWDLSLPTTIAQIREHDLQNHYSHLEWGPSGTDLAILDSKSRLAIWSITMAATNKLTESRSAAEDPRDDLNVPVGMFWLNPDRPHNAFLQASKDNDRWTHPATRKRPFGPHWQRGIVLVTRTGIIRLIYQKLDGAWTDSTLDSRWSLLSAGHLITHAAMAGTQENRLLLAIQTSDQKLFAYYVSIVWTDPKQDPTAPVVPSFSTVKIKGFVSSAISSNNSSLGMLGDGNPTMSDAVRLSQLLVIPTSDIDKAVRLDPIILAIYTSTNRTDIPANDGRPAYSVVCRWIVAAKERTLHARFDDFASKTSMPTDLPQVDLARLEDFRIEQLIISVQQVEGESAIAISTQDGSVAFYNPASMAQLYMHADPYEVTGLSQAGFVFPVTVPWLHSAFSPNGCVLASLTADDKVELTCMQDQMGTGMTTTSPESDPTFEAALAALILAMHRACYANINTEDILLCVLRSFHPDQQTALMSILYKSLFRDADFMASTSSGSELDKLQPKIMVSKALSFHAALAYAPSSSLIAVTDQKYIPARQLAGTFAWLTLNTRYVAMQVYIAFSSAKPGSGSDYTDPAVLDIVCGNIRWALDLFKMIFDDLFDASEQLEAAASHRAGNMTPPSSESKSAALTILLITSLWSRYFLRTISRVLRGLLTVPKSPHYSLSPTALLAFTRIAETIESASFPVSAFERLLEAADKFAQLAYSEAGYGDRERADTERQILATGMVENTVLESVSRRVGEQVLPVMRKEVDRLKLWIGAWRWVVLERGTGRGGHSGEVDIHRKVSVVKGPDEEVRRCVRCGSSSVDLEGPNRLWPKFMQQQLTRCVCEGGFVVERMRD